MYTGSRRLGDIPCLGIEPDISGKENRSMSGKGYSVLEGGTKDRLLQDKHPW